MKIRGIQVEPDAEHDPRAEPRAVVPARVGDRVGGGEEREGLLRQHLLQLFRRDAKPIEAKAQGVEVVAGRRIVAGNSPIVARRLGARGRVAAEHVLLERAQAPAAAEMNAQADDGDGGGIGLALRVERGGRGGVMGVGNPFFNQRVRIDAPEPEPAHRRASGASRGARLPRFGRREEPERTAGGVKRQAGRGEIGGRRERPVPQREQDLEQARRPRGRERMADVRLVRADHAAPRRPLVIAPKRLQALKLDGVADRSAGGVALNQINIGRHPTGLLVRSAEGAQLPLAARREQAAVHVVGQADRRDDAVNVVPLPEGLAQSLEQEHPRPFAHDETAGAGVERISAAIGREGAKLGETHLRIERIRARQPPRQHRVGTPGEDLVRRELERVQRRGARGVQCISAPAEPKRLCQQARRQSRRVTVQRPRRLRRDGSFVVLSTEDAALQGAAQNGIGERGGGLGRQDDVADHDPDAGTVEVLGPRVAPGRAAGVQRQVKHRVEPGDEPSIEVEPLGVELEIRHEPATSRIDLVGRRDFRVERLVGVDGPATGGDCRRGVDPVGDVGPEPFRVGGAGEDAADADDRDALGGVDHGSGVRHIEGDWLTSGSAPPGGAGCGEKPG